MSKEDLNKMIKVHSKKITSQSQMIEKLTDLFISAGLIEKEINQKPEKEIVDGINHNNQLNEIIDASGCNGLDNYWVAWLFQELEDKALSEINKLLLALQEQQIEELRELGIDEKIIKKTKIFKMLHRSIGATDKRYKEIRDAKKEVREEYTKNKEGYKNRRDFIDVNYRNWEKIFPSKLPSSDYIFKEWLKGL